MQTRNLQLYSASQSSTTNGVTSVQVPKSAIITGVTWGGHISSSTPPAYMRWELSVQNSQNALASGIWTVISAFQLGGLMTTSGTFPEMNFVDLGLAVPVNVADYLYVNVYVNGTISGTAWAIVRLSQ